MIKKVNKSLSNDISRNHKKTNISSDEYIESRLNKRLSSLIHLSIDERILYCLFIIEAQIRQIEVMISNCKCATSKSNLYNEIIRLLKEKQILLATSKTRNPTH